jgi:hypothetical protein
MSIGQKRPANPLCTAIFYRVCANPCEFVANRMGMLKIVLLILALVQRVCLCDLCGHESFRGCLNGSSNGTTRVFDEMDIDSSRVGEIAQAFSESRKHLRITQKNLASRNACKRIAGRPGNSADLLPSKFPTSKVSDCLHYESGEKRSARII